MKKNIHPCRPGCEACATERPKDYQIPPPGPHDTIPRGATAAPAPVKAPIIAPFKAPITAPVKGATGAAPATAPQTGVQIKQIVKPAETAAQGLGVPGTSKEIKAPGTVTKEKV